MNERSIFLDALDLSDPAQRAEYLEDVCGEDDILRERVGQLLRAHEDAGQFLEQPPAELQGTLELGQAPDLADAALVHDDLAFLEPCDKPDRIGRLGGYEVIEVLGRGGMGLVLRAVDVKLNRVVAIKVMAPELAANATARQRFLREAQAAAAIAHPHVVTIHAVDDHQRLPFIVMECVEGRTLQDKIDSSGALDLRELLRIAAQTASGLAAAHRQGIVHRDIKPSNVLLENGVERVKLTDFGLARAVDDVNITQTGQIAGTPQYMSPEQAEGKPIDYRSDLFSLGSVMYTMATGRPAFRADSALAVLRRVCDDTPRPICEINSEVPSWLAEIIERLMAKTPESRLQTAEELADLLNQHLAHLQQPALAPKPAPLPPVRVPAHHPQPKPAAIIEAQQRRPQAWFVVSIFLLAVVMLAAVGGVLSLAHLAGRPGVPATSTFVVQVPDPELRVDIWHDGNLLHADIGGGQLELKPGYYDIRVKNVNSRQVVHRETIKIEPGEDFFYRRSFDASEPADQASESEASTAPAITARVPEGERFDGWGSTLSPDGTRVAFQSWEKTGERPSEDLIVLEIATGERTLLMPGGKDPAWSPRPDGPIVFVANRESVEEIWRAQPDGTEARKLVDGGFPCWSADGATLYYYHRPSSELRSLSIDDPTAQPQTVIANPGTMYPVVSPDESMVAVQRGDRLIVMELATTREVAAVPLPGWHGLLAGWSPDSRYVGFGSYATRADGLWILDLETREARQVLQGTLTTPRWSADGKHVTFDDRRKKDVWIVEAESLGLAPPAPPATEAAENIDS